MAEALPIRANTRKSGSFNKRKWIRYFWAYMFILPQLVFFIVFTIYPIIMSYVYSFYDWSGIGPLNKFVGFENYERLLKDRQFWNAFENTFVYMIGVTALLLLTTLLMAILLNNERMKGRTFYRTLYFLPVVTTTSIVGIIMRMIFGNENALVNDVLMSLGILDEPYPWLGKATSAMIVVIIVGAWKFFGMMMVYWLAGLQSLPRDIYESASIDGANAFQAFRHITVPLLLPIGAVVLLLCVVECMHVFDLVKTLTNGGPYFATDMMDLYIYRQAFDVRGFPSLGYASAAGIFFGLSVFAMTLVLVWISRRAKAKD